MFDLDLTLLAERTILCLADRFGVREGVDAVWAASSHAEVGAGEDESRRMAALFRGIPRDEFEAACRSVPLRAGAAEAVKDLQRLGFAVGVASAGFDVATAAARIRLGLDLDAGARLEVVDGRLTGRLLDPEHRGPCGHFVCKESVLRAWTQATAAPFTVGVGDGANDACLLRAAHLGVALEPAHPAARAAATATATHLRDVLPLVVQRLAVSPS